MVARVSRPCSCAGGSPCTCSTSPAAAALVAAPLPGRSARRPTSSDGSTQFRLGIWPDFFPGVQFSREPEALNQYFRSMVPDTGPFDGKVVTDAVSALFDRTGPGILVTHSHSGGFGWRAAIQNRNIRAIVSYEPGSGFIFPEGEVPPPMQVPRVRWKRLACRWRRSCC